MSIDTLLEAARYLEWQAQQQQITREQEHEQKVWSVDSRCLEVVTSAPQPLRANNDASGGDHQQPQPSPAPPQSSFPSPKAHIAVIPMVPMVAAVASAPLPLPLSAAIASAATNSSAPIKAESPPIKTECLPSHPLAHHNLLCAPHIKLEPSPLLIGGNHSQFQPQVQIPYAASISNAGSQHALLSLQASPSSQSRANGMTVDDIRGLDGKRRPGGAGTREVHNKLEKNRRAHLKECFETLKKNVPNVDEKKTSNLSVLRSALRYIQTLKRKEKEYEHEMERLAREKISMQQRLSQLKSDLSQCMDVVEIDRVLRQTAQPEDDQVSTSTASEGEEILDQGMDEDVAAPRPPATSLPKAPPAIFQAQPVLTPHLSIQHALLTSSGPAHPLPQAIAPHPAPTVIAHAAVSHPSVIQAVSHGLPANHKHLAHIAPSPGPLTSSSSSSAAVVQPMTVPQPIGHITVHPVAHLGAGLPALYPQGVSVSQATVVGHITHSFGQRALPHAGAQVNGAVLGQAGLGKPTAVLAPHPQLVGQTAVLNPVTMVTVPPFPVSTLKLA